MFLKSLKPSLYDENYPNSQQFGSVGTVGGSGADPPTSKTFFSYALGIKHCPLSTKNLKNMI